MMLLKQELIESLVHKYERFIAPFTFIIGFIFDALTLKRIDLWLEHLVILFYLVLAGFAIAVINLYETGRIRIKVVDVLMPFAPILLQFAFGGLLSAFVIFYTKSAAFGKSWIFLLALVILLVGNEWFRKKYQRLVFQICIFFIAIFSYTIFALPIFLGKIGDDVFLLSGFLSIGLVVLYLLIFYGLIYIQIHKYIYRLILGIGLIYTVFNIMYFTNILPPVPVSLKEAGLYHSIEVKNGNYLVSFEPSSGYLFFKETSRIFHRKQNEEIYFFSSVFAPTSITLTIFHRWYFYEKSKKEWVEKENVKYIITGGRDGGFRGFSFKTNVETGDWKIDVTTETDQIIGRETFKIVNTDENYLTKISLK